MDRFRRERRKYDLEERLIQFSLLIMKVVDKTYKSQNGIHLSKQLSRSGTSVFLHYGEAISAESRKDFIHKMKVVLKELRETRICLTLISKGNLINSDQNISSALIECTELILIFSKSIETAKSNYVINKSKKGGVEK
jgi:four helix bundle protein